MKGKVNVGGAAPSKAPKPMKCGEMRPAPMVGKPSRKTVRGAGAAIRGKSYVG